MSERRYVQVVIEPVFSPTRSLEDYAKLYAEYPEAYVTEDYDFDGDYYYKLVQDRPETDTEMEIRLELEEEAKERRKKQAREQLERLKKELGEA